MPVGLVSILASIGSRYRIAFDNYHRPIGNALPSMLPILVFTLQTHSSSPYTMLFQENFPSTRSCQVLLHYPNNKCLLQHIQYLPLMSMLLTSDLRSSEEQHGECSRPEHSEADVEPRSHISVHGCTLPSKFNGDLSCF